MMKIDIAKAAGALGREFPFAFETTADALEAAGADFSFEGPVTAEGSLVYTGVCYRVHGTVKAVKHFVCDRCLADCCQEQVHEFVEEYRSEECGTEDSAEAEIFTGDSIDVEALVRDTLLASQSLSKLCRPDCKGLCPVCGKNLNEGDCGCDRFVPDPRLAALQQLMKED